VRARARKRGNVIHKSRSRSIHEDNLGKYALVKEDSDDVVLGARVLTLRARRTPNTWIRAPAVMGHGYRANRPNTWLLRPLLQGEGLLANPEPSTPGPSRDTLIQYWSRW
jgi:hypothetical protein